MTYTVYSTAPINLLEKQILVGSLMKFTFVLVQDKYVLVPINAEIGTKAYVAVRRAILSNGKLVVK